MQKLAIFGGTFNPVHWGHLLIAETAIDQFALDQIIWLPTYHPAYKASADLLSFQHRAEMVRRAIDSHPHFSLSTLEQNQPSPSHAIDSLHHLQTNHPGNQWYWLIGLDAFQTLPHWYCYEELVSRCNWLVSPRWRSQEPEAENQEHGSTPSQNSLLLCQQVAEKLAAESLELKWHLLDTPLIGVSSSLVRQRCRDRRSIRYLVPESVQTYITQQNLYQREGKNLQDDL